MNALDAWRTRPWPSSHWKRGARRTIMKVLDEHGPIVGDVMPLLKKIDAAYPFGERSHLPYKMWLEERKVIRAVLLGAQEPLTEDEIAVCHVAYDLVEERRLDEAKALLEEQAPNRHSRACPACGRAVGKPCRSVDGFDLIIPHETRLRLVAGPLFGDRP